MPGTPRKTAPRKRAAKKASPTPPATSPVESGAFDLLDALGTEPQEPVDVTLLGVEATIRRTYSAAEDLEFAELLTRKRVKEALEIIAGDAAEALTEKLAGLTPEQAVKVLNRLAQISTLYVGEAMALLPTSAQRMVGAPATPSSAGSTS
jgi:hypothetical protein